MTTADTYRPLPWSPADLRRLKKAFRVHAPDVELDRGQTETGEPHISVTDPRAGFDDAPPCITRNERGWQMVRGGNGPLYEFATEREVAEFIGSGGLTVGPLGMMRPEPARPSPLPPRGHYAPPSKGRYGRRR